MRIPNFQDSKWATLLVAGLAALLLLPACSVNVKKNEAGEDKNVDIQTPVGAIHVSKDADVRDTGLSVYPGAKEKPKVEGGDEKQANVNISGFGFGLRVVAIEYTSDDPPQKLLDYYRDQLKKYGEVLECHTDQHTGEFHVGIEKKGDSGQLTCDGHKGSTIELKAGTQENQHIVAVEPKDRGSDFALVYVRAHGKEGTI